ncbi:MAG TPA: D-cysteine desulfhydrase family protein, partial [Vicinamibacteria bacterium]|nr:D-cysteine desulfhydrase family protein [Vicinamibacteria bacterium]
KRDDGTGLGAGGNKARKLEFLLGEALALGADTVVTVGGVQSNHVRQTAAAAARLGLRCEAVLLDAVARADAAYRSSGNVLLDRLFGACLHFAPAGADAESTLEELAGRLRRSGARPYVVPMGGSSALGCLGYAEAAAEILAQAEALDVRLDHVVVACGSAGTQAGLVAGFAAQGSPAAVHGVSVYKPSATDACARVRELAEATLVRLGAREKLGPDAVRVDARQLGDGYGLPTAAMVEAVSLMARTEGVLLDPVYTGKAMAGLLQWIREGAFGVRETVVFWHTGGLPGLFAYPDVF